MKRTDLRRAREEERRRGNREIVLRAAEAVILHGIARPDGPKRSLA